MSASNGLSLMPPLRPASPEWVLDTIYPLMMVVPEHDPPR
jgi:hypothetical protein